MLIPDDDQQFEMELKRYLPRKVTPFHPAEAPRPQLWRGPMAIAAVAILAVGGILLWRHDHRTLRPSAELRWEVNAGGPTLGRAQVAITQASSFEEAIDGLDRAPRPQTKSTQHGNRSALEALGREKL